MVRGNRLSDVVDRIGDLDVQVARLEDGVVNLNQQVTVLGVPVFVRLQPVVVAGPQVRLGDLGEVHRDERGLLQILHEQRSPADVLVALVRSSHTGDGKQVPLLRLLAHRVLEPDLLEALQQNHERREEHLFLLLVGGRRGAVCRRHILLLFLFGRDQLVHETFDPRSKIGGARVTRVEISDGAELSVILLRPLVLAHREKTVIEFVQVIVTVCGLRQLHHTDLDHQRHEVLHLVHLPQELVAGQGVGHRRLTRVRREVGVGQVRICLQLVGLPQRWPEVKKTGIVQCDLSPSAIALGQLVCRDLLAFLDRLAVLVPESRCLRSVLLEVLEGHGGCSGWPHGALNEGSAYATGGIVVEWRHQVLGQADSSIVRRRVRGGVEQLHVVIPMEAHDRVFAAILRHRVEFELVVTCLLLGLPERLALIADLPRRG